MNILLTTIISTASAADGPPLERHILRVCGAEAEDTSLYVRNTTFPLGGLGEWMVLGKGVDPDLSVSVVTSDGPISNVVWRSVGERAALGLGYKARRRGDDIRVSAPGRRDPETAPHHVTILVQQTDAGPTLSDFPGESLSLAPFLTLATANGLSLRRAGAGALSGDWVSEMPEFDIPLGPAISALGGTLPANPDARMWVNLLPELCDAIATHTGTLFLIEQDIGFELMLASPSEIAPGALLDVIAAVASKEGAELLRDDGALLLQRDHKVKMSPRAERPFFLSMLLPSTAPDALGHLYDGVKGITAQPVEGGVAVIMDLAELQAPLLPGASSREQRKQLQERVEARREQFQGGKFTIEGDTVRFPREAIARLAHEPLVGLTAAHTADGSVEGYSLQHPEQLLLWLGLRRADVLLRWSSGQSEGAPVSPHALASPRDLEEMVRAMLTEPSLSVVVRRGATERVSTWIIAGDPLALTSAIPEPALLLSLEDLRLKNGVTATATSVRLARSSLPQIALGGWGGRFRTTPDHIQWLPNSRTTGLQLLLGDSPIVLSSLDGSPIDDEAGIKRLVDALLDRPIVEIGVETSGSKSVLKIELIGPAIPVPDGWREPISFDIAGVTADERCRVATLQSSGARGLVHRGADGSVDGLRISSIRAGDFHDRLGLLNGDVLLRIDGISLVTEDADKDWISGPFPRALSTPGHHVISMVRRGQPVEVNVDVSDGPACGTSP